MDLDVSKKPNRGRELQMLAAVGYSSINFKHEYVYLTAMVIIACFLPSINTAFLVGWALVGPLSSFAIGFFRAYRRLRKSKRSGMAGVN